MKEIKLTQGQVALVDNKDFEWLNQYKWCASWCDSIKGFYAVGRISGENVRMARIILNCPDDMVVDHKNHDTLNNQKHNLRICTESQNQQNQKPHINCASKYKGVTRRKDRNVWRASIQVYNIFDELIVLWLGHFKIEEEAALAYDKAASEEFGEFAYLNFPIKEINNEYRRN